jgi:hypothetical protein
MIAWRSVFCVHSFPMRFGTWIYFVYVSGIANFDLGAQEQLTVFYV